MAGLTRSSTERSGRQIMPRPFASHSLSDAEYIQKRVNKTLAADRDEAILAEQSKHMQWSSDEDDDDLPAPIPPPSAEPPAAVDTSLSPPPHQRQLKLLLPHGKLNITASEASSSQLNKPSCVIALPSGDLCVADTAADRLLVLSPDMQAVRTELTGDAHSTLRQPRGLACDATALYVSEVGGSRVRKMRLPDELRQPNGGAETPRGSHLGGLRLEAQSAVEGTLTFPQGLALSRGELFVCDCEDHRVAVYDSLTLTYKRGFGEFGDAEGELSFPYGCAVVGDEVIVCDVANDRLSVFHRTTGAFVRCIGGDGELLSNPRGLAIIPLQTSRGPAARGATAVPSMDGRRVHEESTALVVVERTRIVVLSLGGMQLQALPIEGAIDMWSVCACHNGRVYVSDKGASAIHVLVPSSCSSPSPGSSNFTSALGSPFSSPTSSAFASANATPLNSPGLTRVGSSGSNAGRSPHLCSTAVGSGGASGGASPRTPMMGSSPGSGVRRRPSLKALSDPEAEQTSAIIQGLLTGQMPAHGDLFPYSSSGGGGGNSSAADSLQQPSAPSAASSSRITSAIYRRIAGVRSPAIEPRESPAPGASDRTAQFV